MPNKDFFKTNFFTGFIALLPLTLLFAVIAWLYNIISIIIQPIAQIYGTPSFVTNLLAMTTFIIVIFLIGLTVRTAPGKLVSEKLDKYVFAKIPGYKTIKEIIKPFRNNNYQKSFKSVVLVNLYENSVLVTGFVTDKSIKKGYTTVFIPTGPNPTSGQIVHLKNKYIHYIDIPVETVLKSVIAVGRGSSKLLEKMKK